MNTQLVSIVIAFKKNSSEDFSLWMQDRVENGPLDGFWEFPGGKLGADESPEECAIRELREEVGIELSKKELELFKVYPYNYPDRRVSLFTFVTYQDTNFPNKGWKTFSFENPINKENQGHLLEANHQILRDLASFFRK